MATGHRVLATSENSGVDSITNYYFHNSDKSLCALRCSDGPRGSAWLKSVISASAIARKLTFIFYGSESSHTNLILTSEILTNRPVEMVGYGGVVAAADTTGGPDALYPIFHRLYEVIQSNPP